MLEKNDIDRSMHHYYEKRAGEYDEWYNRLGNYNDAKTNAAWHAQVGELARFITRFAETIPNGPQTRVLDLACGTGKWTPYLARPLHEQARLIAYDYALAMLSETHARLQDQADELLGKINFVRGDAYALPFADSTFDCVFFGFWLSHVPRERIYAFFSEIKRVLKPSGQVLIYDSALLPGKQAENLQNRRLNDGSVYPVLKIYYTPAELHKLLERVFADVSAQQTRDYFIIGRATL